MGFGDGFRVSPLTASAIQNFAADVLAIAGGGGGGGGTGDALTGSTNIFRADQIISGNLNIDGTITAKQFNVVTSSVLYTSGSTKFGDSPDDTHQFTGSVIGSTGFTGSFSGSFIGDGSQLSGLLTSINSSHIVYVNSGSADATENGTLNKPYKTIQAALNSASVLYSNFSESVYINIEPGLYTENLTISRPNTYLKSNLGRYEQRGVKIVGKTTLDCANTPVNGKYLHVVGLEGLYFQSNTPATTASLYVTANGYYSIYLTDCFVYSNNADVSALKVTGSFNSKKIVIKDSSFDKSSVNMTANLVDIQGGDVKIDTCEIYGSGSGAALNIGGDSVILADRLLLQNLGLGRGITNSSTILPTTASLTLSNTSITTVVGTNNSLVSNNTTYLTDTTLASAIGAPTVSGSSTGVYVYYNDLVSPSGSYPALLGATYVPMYELHGKINASELSGNISSSYIQGTIPVNKGGTGLTTLKTGSILIGNGTDNVAYLSGSASDNGKVVTWVSGAFTLTGSSAAGLNITPTAEGQTLISSGTSFVAARPIAGNNIVLDFASGSITVKLSSSLDNLTSVSSSWFTGSLKGTAQTASYVNPLTQSVYINGDLSASSGITGSFSGSIASSSMITNFVTDVQNIAAGSGLRAITGSSNISITAGQYPTASLNNSITLDSIVVNNKITAVTGSFQLLETVSASSLMVGDKYIVIMSGASDHTTLNGSGLLWGSGTLDPTSYTDLSASAAIIFNSGSDVLQAYPGLSSSFTGSFKGDGSQITNISAGNLTGVVKTVSATAPMSASIAVNGQLSVALNSGSVNFNGTTVALGASGSISLVSAIVTGSNNITASSSSLTGAVTLSLNTTLTGLTSISSSQFTGSGANLTNVASSLTYASATPALALTQVVALSGGLVAAVATDRLRANAFGVIQASSSAGYIVQTSGEVKVAFSSSNAVLLVTGSEIYVSSSGTASLYEDIAGNPSGRYATQIGYLNRKSGADHYIIISPRPFGLVY